MVSGSGSGSRGTRRALLSGEIKAPQPLGRLCVARGRGFAIPSGRDGRIRPYSDRPGLRQERRIVGLAELGLGSSIAALGCACVEQPGGRDISDRQHCIAAPQQFGKDGRW
jgi:hypothetical protein